MSPNDTLTVIAANQAAWGGPVPPLGEIVWWNLSGLRLQVADLEARCRAAGVAERHVPRPEASGALARALRTLGIAKTCGEGVTRRYELTYPQGEIVATVYDETVTLDPSLPAGASASYQSVQVVRYDRASRALTFATGWLAPEIASAWDAALGVIESSGVATTIRRALDEGHAVRLRTSGGLYFVPREHAGVAHAVRALVEGLEGAQVVSLPLADVEAARADVLRAAASEIQADVAGLQADLAELREGGARASTIARRGERYAAIREKAQAYAELVGFAAADVLGAVGELETEAARLAAEREREARA